MTDEATVFDGGGGDSAAPETQSYNAETASEATATDDTSAGVDEALERAFDAVGAPDDPSEEELGAQDLGGRPKKSRVGPNETNPNETNPNEKGPNEKGQNENGEGGASSARSPFDTPTRFTADAKEAWKHTPKPVQAEINRAISELETGIDSYKQKLGSFEGLDDYAALAKQHGTSLKQGMENYVNLERTLHQDPLRGLQAVAEYAGLNLRDVAAHVMGQAPDAVATQQDNEMRGLKAEIFRLNQELGGVASGMQVQARGNTERGVAGFADDRPRFDELSGTMSQLITKGMAADLSKAYEMADRLIPGSGAPSRASARGPNHDLTAQTRKGSLSVTGSPAPGSNPANRRPATSPDEAIDRAFDSVGLN